MGVKHLSLSLRKEHKLRESGNSTDSEREVNPGKVKCMGYVAHTWRWEIQNLVRNSYGKRPIGRYKCNDQLNVVI
jgi:hypothetical protein